MAKRILHVVAQEPVGGVGTFLTNSLTTDRDYDLAETVREEESSFNQIMRQKGVRIQAFPDFRQPLAYASFCKTWYQERARQYAAIHVHSPAVALPHLYYARKYGVPVRIYHAHGLHFGRATLAKRFRNRLLVAAIQAWATHLTACGHLVAEDVFGSEAEITLLPNTIEIEAYAYKPQLAQQLREELGLSVDARVLGMVGSFTANKNQGFAMDLLNRLGQPYHLVFIGDGEERADLEARSQERVHFLGRRSPVADYYGLFDAFLLPSYSEGFPLVALEAQANGLPCFFSKGLDTSIALTQNCHFLDLKRPEDWLAAIKEQRLVSEQERLKAYQILKGRFDLEQGQAALLKFYQKVLK